MRSQGRVGGGRLIVVLGDQLDEQSSALRDADPRRDTVLMMEVREESTHVPSHRARTVLFLSAMRHFADRLRARGMRVRYVALDDPANTHSFTGEVRRAIADDRPSSIAIVEPGEHRVTSVVRAWHDELGIPVDVRPDDHFLTSPAQFAAWREGRRELTMEHFYRWQRRRLGVLMEGDEPRGGRWNFDADNREPFPKQGPTPRPSAPKDFPPDQITRDVMALVERDLAALPGSLEGFAWPVTREHALAALRDFINHRLPLFGRFEDAMWQGESVLFHSTLSAPLNLKLLHPRECVDAAISALDKGKAPIESVEAFVRQLIGWREFVRCVYTHEGPDYAHRNGLSQHGRLPAFYWDGNTDMACMRECVGQVVRSGYAHHIQRLMVLGNFALTSGVHPRALSDWFLGMFVDGVEWVTLPNALGMAMHADGSSSGKSVVGTKPYASTGQYIKRMSNYCVDCRFDPAQRTGPRACPFSTFYWDFLARHRERFRRNPRMAQIVAGLSRLGDAQVTQVQISATSLRDRFAIGSITTPNPEHEASGRTYLPRSGGIRDRPPNEDQGLFG